jgi:hypothetical protein
MLERITPYFEGVDSHRLILLFEEKENMVGFYV